MTSCIIRPIEKKDSKAIASIIRSVLLELGAPKIGTAYEDASLYDMYSEYQKDNTQYFVIERQGEILGGAGIAPLLCHKEDICELQKMYYLPIVRGTGLGAQMIRKCLATAKQYGYKKCYLETMPYMKAAQRLYLKNGFDYLENALGDTGHYSCSVYMLKKL